MSVELNHTIVHCRDKRESAEFLAKLLDLEVGPETGSFIPVGLSNGVTLDFASVAPDAIRAQHYAFLISEAEFDAAFARLREAGTTYHSGPRLENPGQINHNDGGRGVYFLDPSGHVLELMTRPYGG